MKKYILKAVLLFVIWAIAYGVAYLGSIMTGRSEVSNWGFCITVGFTVAFGPKISDYIIGKFKK